MRFNLFMKMFLVGVIILLTMGLFMNDISAAPKDKSRADIDEKYKWNLADLFETKSDWEKGKDTVSKKFKKIGQCATLDENQNAWLSLCHWATRW